METISSKKTMKELENEYSYEFSLFCKDVRSEKAKLILSRQSPPDRRLIILYAETRSLRDVARELCVSHWTIAKRVNHLKEIFRREMDRSYEELLTKNRVPCYPRR